MAGAISDPRFPRAESEEALRRVGGRFHVVSDQALIDQTAAALVDGKAVGWFQGRMEFGPRALGARSILGDARSPQMQSVLNLKVKYRESFRPFAPSVLREDVAQWFDLDGDSPYMLLVADVAKHLQREMTEEEQTFFGIDKLRVPRSSIPAVTHVDYSARIQTVHRETNPRFHALTCAVQGLDRVPGPGEHKLQRPGRATGGNARGCLSLLHGHRHRGTYSRELLSAQGGPGPESRERLRDELSTGLTSVLVRWRRDLIHGFMRRFRAAAGLWPCWRSPRGSCCAPLKPCRPGHRAWLATE